MKNKRLKPSEKALNAAKLFGDYIVPNNPKGAGGQSTQCWRSFFCGKENEFYEELALYLDKYEEKIRINDMDIKQSEDFSDMPDPEPLPAGSRAQEGGMD